jgi:hypothetical protein
MNRIKPDKIDLLSVTVLKTSILPSSDYLLKPKEPSAISVGYFQKSEFDFDKGLVMVSLNIKLIGKDEKENDIGLEGEFSIEFIFEVENFNEFILENKEIVNDKEVTTRQVDGILGSTLIGIAYSTARGIILERTQGTLFQPGGVILPVIDPGDLLD